MAGNGDERRAQTLNRIEAKLDRVVEEVQGMRRLLQTLGEQALLQAQAIGALRGELGLRVDLGAARLDVMESPLSALARRIEALKSR
jgi:hypothetical protein